MPDRPLRTVLDGWSYLECPRWHDGRAYVSDFYTEQVLAVSLDGGEPQTVARVPGQPSGLGWLPDGSMLVVSMRDRRLRAGEAEPEVHAVLSELAPWHLNDMVVDAAGRAFVGNFGFDLMSGADPSSTDLIRIDPDGAVSVAASDLWFPNGTVITPDGGTLIVGETVAARYTRFSIAKDGTLGDRAVWGQMEPEPTFETFEQTLAELKFAPDGCALDAEGCIWSADAVGGRVARHAPGGEIVEVVHGPEGLGVFACMLGGEDGRTLLICAAPDFLEHLRMDKREAVLLTATVDVPHAGLP